jgi:DNA-binding transcriptional ArsR family regulator
LGWKTEYDQVAQRPIMPSLASQIAQTAHLLGIFSRANILSALMHGRALDAFDLASEAQVTPQTASFHLAKLLDGKLITAEKRGRHRFYRLATPLVGQMLQGISMVAALGPQRYRPPLRGEPEIRQAKICYDHIAGKLGAAITSVLIDRMHIVLDEDAGMMTKAGRQFFHRHGIMPSRAEPGQRVFCRACLDWSGPRPHLAGRVGAALCQHFFKSDWLRRGREIRALEMTPLGETALSDLFGLSLRDL